MSNSSSMRCRRWGKQPKRELHLARIAALAGNVRESVDLLRKLLTQPSGITVPVLRQNPDWDNLRDDSEFKALLADPKNSAPI